MLYDLPETKASIPRYNDAVAPYLYRTELLSGTYIILFLIIIIAVYDMSPETRPGVVVDVRIIYISHAWGHLYAGPGHDIVIFTGSTIQYMYYYNTYIG